MSGDGSSSSYTAPTSLKELLATEKGTLCYDPTQSFLLHVFWEAPNAAAAKELLSALRKCGEATHRDTPCVPLYFFRVAENNKDLCSAAPSTIGDHPHLAQAQKKLKMGVPLPAVRAQVAKLGLDPALIDLDPSAPLPEELIVASRPVCLEFTELYLDERAFIEHAGSRDYLDGHGQVMNPALCLTTPVTVRMGNPPRSLIEKILEPALKEVVMPLAEGCCLWNSDALAGAAKGPIFLSLDLEAKAGTAEADVAASIAAAVPPEFRKLCSTLVVFPHPKRAASSVARLMCVLPRIPDQAVLSAFAASVCISRAEIHLDGSAEGKSLLIEVRSAFEAAGFPAAVTSVGNELSSGIASSGYILHSKAAEVRAEKAVKEAGAEGIKGGADNLPAVDSDDDDDDDDYDDYDDYDENNDDDGDDSEDEGWLAGVSDLNEQIA